MLDTSKVYIREECVCFRKTTEAFGGLSNMASGFPLRLHGMCILTSEALYQACKYPHLPDLQRKIIAERSPMSAKMVQKPFGDQVRPDWDNIRVEVMRWCLCLKLFQNPVSFGRLLESTGNREIVEDSRKDNFWGAIPSGDDSILTGCNVLGKLLSEIRGQHRMPDKPFTADPPNIPDFRLFGEPLVVDYPTPPEPPLTDLFA